MRCARTRHRAFLELYRCSGCGEQLGRAKRTPKDMDNYEQNHLKSLKCAAYKRIWKLEEKCTAEIRISMP